MDPHQVVIIALLGTFGVFAVACEQQSAVVVKTTYRFHSAEAASTLVTSTRSEERAVRSPKMLELGSAGSPTLGPLAPKVTMVLGGSYGQPASEKMLTMLRRVQARYAEHVSLVFMNLPTRAEPSALSSARASMAAHLQGKFWAYHDALMTRDSVDIATLKSVAREVGLDLRAWESDRLSVKVSAKVKHDHASLLSLNHRRAPVLYINGRLADEAVTAESIERAVKAAILAADEALEGGIAQRALHRHFGAMHAGEHYVTSIIEGNRPPRGRTPKQVKTP